MDHGFLRFYLQVLLNRHFSQYRIVFLNHAQLVKTHPYDSVTVNYIIILIMVIVIKVIMTLIVSMLVAYASRNKMRFCF